MNRIDFLRRLKKLRDSPIQLALAFLLPMLLLQVVGVPKLASLIEEEIFPASRSIGVARIELAPISLDGETISGRSIPWSELLLLTHSAPGSRDFAFFSSRSDILGVSAGASEPTPNLKKASTADPRRLPLFKVRLPRKKLLAAAVHTSSLQNEMGAEEQQLWLEDGETIKHFSRANDSLVAMSENEYLALTLSYVFSVAFASIASVTLRNAKPLEYPGEQNVEMRTEDFRGI